jgi:tetratricopeptide (TPR) repeat protein
MTLDFDSNSIADARLIRTFPLAQTEMNSLEIEFRGAWNLYVGNRFQEALSAFARQSGYAGNYLSPYWAGMSAWKLGDRNLAIAWFNSALEINPYFQPARNGLLNAVNNARPETAPPAGRTRKRR